MMTGPRVSRCESLTASPLASGRMKSGACAPSLRAFSAAPELMSCPIGRSKSCSRFVGNQLAPSAINSSICCCNGVFVGTAITMIVLLVILAFASSSCGRSAHLKCLFQAGDYQTAQLYKWSSPVEKLERTLGTTVWSPLQRERVERLLL